MPRLPPPDPCEPTGEPPGLALTAPAVIFLSGPADAKDDRIASAVLTARPGALFVV